MTRNYAIDNAKLLMIFIVIFGHLIESIINSSTLLKTIYMSIYSFHMPVFIILAGMVTRVELTKERVGKLMDSLFIPFVAFTILYEVYTLFMNGHLSGYTINFQPYWILWFLLSLFFWRVFLPFVLRFRYPITLSIAISLVAGYIDQIGYFFGLSRTLYFFPFFLIGYKLTPSFLSHKRLVNTPLVVYVGILLLNVALFWFLSDYSQRWLYGSNSYANLGVKTWEAAGIRLGLYTISIITSISIMMLIPKKEFKISSYGSNSLYVYLWHGFFIKTFIALGLISLIGKMNIVVALVVFFVLALVLTALLSTHFVVRNTQRYILMPVKKLLLAQN
jgi:fucose 4-O-acetylase-like acetyltransferase